MKKILLAFITLVLVCGINNVYAQNYITGGTFEDTGEYVYGTGTHSDKVVGIENCSIKAHWPQHSRIMGYSSDAFSGSRSLHINQTGKYYPTTFTVKLECKSVYKFSARIKLTEDSTQASANLLATTKTTGWSSGFDIMALKNGERDNLYQVERVDKSDWSDDKMTFSTTEWKLYERYIYVDSAGKDTLTAHIGLAHLGGVFDYYIDDVSLTKIDTDISIDDGYGKVYAVNGKNKVYTYKAQSYFFSQDDMVWSVEGDTQGVSIDQSGNLMVSEDASGNISIIASALNELTGETVRCKKEVEIIPFTENGMVVNINGESLEGFSPYNENYIYEYRGENEPQITIAENGEIIKNENTVFVSNGAKTYDIILKKLPEYSDNLLYDGGFEEGVVDDKSMTLEERSGSLSITKNNVHSGRYALKVNANKYTTLAMRADVKPGKLYMVSMWVKKSQNAETNKLFPCFYTNDDATVEFYSKADNAFINGGVFSSGNHNRCITATDRWQRVDTMIRVSGNADNVKLKFGFSIYTLTSEYYVDDVSLYEIDMTKTQDTYIGAVYKNENGEIVTDIANADYAEIYAYNPDRKLLDMNIYVAEYIGKKLSCVQQGTLNCKDVAAITTKKLELSEGTDNISVYVWNQNNSPYIEPVWLKGENNEEIL